MQYALLSGEDISRVFPLLRAPPGLGGLYHPAGGVLRGSSAVRALRAMAVRAGADVMSGGRVLTGWKVSYAVLLSRQPWLTHSQLHNPPVLSN